MRYIFGRYQFRRRADASAAQRHAKKFPGSAYIVVIRAALEIGQGAYPPGRDRLVVARYGALRWEPASDVHCRHRFIRLLVHFHIADTGHYRMTYRDERSEHKSTLTFDVSIMYSVNSYNGICNEKRGSLY